MARKSRGADQQYNQKHEKKKPMAAVAACHRKRQCESGEEK
jgi:hypothetical protein